jgi:predicted transcriptional regulator
MKFLPKTIRAAIMVRDIMKRSHSSADDVRLLKESVSSLYRTRFDALPSQQQRILIALAGETEGLKLSGIREKTGQSASAISPYLTQMIENGIITRDSTSQRGGAYRISDLLLELWLQ